MLGSSLFRCGRISALLVGGSFKVLTLDANLNFGRFLHMIDRSSHGSISLRCTYCSSFKDNVEQCHGSDGANRRNRTFSLRVLENTSVMHNPLIDEMWSIYDVDDKQCNPTSAPLTRQLPLGGHNDLTDSDVAGDALRGTRE